MDNSFREIMLCVLKVSCLAHESFIHFQLLILGWNIRHFSHFITKFLFK